MKKVLSIVLAVVLLTSVFTACGSSSGGEQATTTSAAGDQSQASSTGEVDKGKVDTNASFELSFITSMTDDSRTKLLEATIKKFNEKWPNVKVVNDSTGDYGQKLKLAFSSGEGYDLPYLDDLNQQTLQKNNYLMDITQDVLERKWIDKEIKGAVEFNNLRTPGKYFSVPFLMAPVVVYYNKDIFTKLNAQPPQTYDEFLSICDKAKAAGYVPMENSGVNNYNLLWAAYHLIFTKVSMEDVNKWYYVKETTPAFQDAFTFALKQSSEWVKKDYFRKGYTATDPNNIISLYGQGKTAMLVSGDWDLPTIEQTNIPTGVFAFPRVDTNLPKTIVNATDGAWALNAKLPAEKKAAALDFIDTFTSPDIIKMWYEGGLTPAVKFDASQAKVSPLKAELNKAVEDTQIGFYLDNALPGFLDVLTKQTQLLELNKVTPEECWKQINEEYEKLKAQNAGK